MNNSNAGRKPDFILFARPKEDGNKGGGAARIGAGWNTTSGAGVKGISFRLSPGVRIGWDDELWLSMWPNEERQWVGQDKPRMPETASDKPSDPNDDYPF